MKPNMTSVLCVPGRGAFDEVTAAIAVQLLGAAGSRADDGHALGLSQRACRRTELQGRADHLHHLARRAGIAAVFAQHAAAHAGMAAEGDPGCRRGRRTESGPETGATGASHAAPTFRAMIEECTVGASVQHSRQASQRPGRVRQVRAVCIALARIRRAAGA